jgi:predicted transcriptional regulator
MMRQRGFAVPARKIASSPDRLTVTLDATEREQLERLSRDTDRSLAWHVREALRQYLPRARDQSEKDKASGWTR